MKVYKTLFWVAFIAGLTIFSIGVYLKFANQSSDGLTAGRFRNIHHGMITGFSGMFLGILIFCYQFGHTEFIKKKNRNLRKWNERQLPTKCAVIRVSECIQSFHLA